MRSELETSFVSTTIGQSTDTPIPLSLTSRANVSARPTTPYLATPYAPRPALGTSPANDAVKAMWPPAPCSSSLGTNASTAWIEPHRSISMTQRQSSCDICASGPATAMPALLNRTSHITPCASNPSACIRATACSSAGLSTSASTTRAPRRANSVAVAKPMPLAPPVMTVPRPSNPAIPFTDRMLLKAATRIDGQGHAGDVARLVGGEEQHGVADVHRFHPRDRQRVEQLTDRRHVVGPRAFQVGPEHLEGALVVQHGGCHMGWMHRVDANHLLPQLNREGTHQADDAVLGGDVVAGVRVRLESADRAGQDDRPAAATGQDVRDPGLHGLPYPRQVDVDHFCPVLFAGFVQRFTAIADAGVRDDDVEPAQLLHPAVHGGLQGGVVPHIDFGGEDSAVMALDEVGGLRQILRRGRWNRGVHDAVSDGLTDIDGDDVGAFLRQPHRVAAALTACRPGDESDLALDTSGHDYLISPT